MLIFANLISTKDILMNFTRAVLLLSLPLCFFSCSPQKQLPNYLETVSKTSDSSEVTIPELRIKKDDILSIQVYSASTDPRVDEMYNLRPATTTTGGGQSPVSGFLVDAKGNIEY